MFSNIGKKIKKLATVLCWLGIIISIVCGIVAWVAADDEIGALIFLVVAVAGSLLSWISSFVLYGFGELIDKVTDIEYRLNPVRTQNNQNQDTVEYTFVDKQEPSHSFLGNCEMCDKTEVLVCEAKIVDKMGTRYRKVCKDCFNKYNCQPK
ncbi:MAG: magnesium transporter [Clostridia bacterium]|nr:magnesium transporter [Clostridia bacterium]